MKFNVTNIDLKNNSCKATCKRFLISGMCFKNIHFNCVSICPRGYSQFFIGDEMYCGFFANDKFDVKFKKYITKEKKEFCHILNNSQKEEIDYILNNITDYESNENCLHEIIHMSRDLDFINYEYESNRSSVSKQLESYSNLTGEIVFYITAYNKHKDEIDKKLETLDCCFPYEKEACAYYIRNYERTKALEFITKKLEFVFTDDFCDYEKLSKKEKKYRIYFASHFLLMHSRIIANLILGSQKHDGNAINYNVQLSFVDHLIEVMQAVSMNDGVSLILKGNEIWPSIKKKYRVSLLFIVSLYILIENAKKYSVGEKQIHLNKNVYDNSITIKISNETDEVGVEDLNILRTRGAKGMNQKGEKSNGLGLYIVDNMINRIGGVLRLGLSSNKKIFIAEISASLFDQ